VKSIYGHGSFEEYKIALSEAVFQKADEDFFNLMVSKAKRYARAKHKKPSEAKLMARAMGQMHYRMAAARMVLMGEAELQEEYED